MEIKISRDNGAECAKNRTGLGYALRYSLALCIAVCTQCAQRRHSCCTRRRGAGARGSPRCTARWLPYCSARGQAQEASRYGRWVSKVRRRCGCEARQAQCPSKQHIPRERGPHAAHSPATYLVPEDLRFVEQRQSKEVVDGLLQRYPVRSVSACHHTRATAQPSRPYLGALLLGQGIDCLGLLEVSAQERDRCAAQGGLE